MNRGTQISSAVLTALLVPTFVARAQVVRGVLLSAADNQPLAYGTIAVGDGTQGRFTDATGQFVLAPGSHRIRAQDLGFWPLDTTVADNGGTSRVVLRLRPLAIDENDRGTKLRGCTATGLSTGSEPALLLLHENLDRFQILVDQYPFRYHWQDRRYLRGAADRGGDRLTGYTPGADSTLAIDTVSFDSRDQVSYTVGSVMHRQGSGAPIMAIPTLRDLADPAFQASHCFAYGGSAKGELRVDFRPADSIRVPDVMGSLYLDATRYVLRRAVFQLTHPELVSGSLEDLSVTTTFQEVVPLVPITAVTYTAQHLRPGSGLSQPSASSHGMSSQFMTGSSSDVDRTSVTEGRMLDHTFLGDTIGSLVAVGAPRAPAANANVTIAVACSMPPSFETADMPIYATLAGPGVTDAVAVAALTAIRPVFRMPSDLTLSVYTYSTGPKVAQTLEGAVAFTVEAGGHIAQVGTAVTSLSAGVDSALVSAVRSAGASGAFARLRAGQYELFLSSSTPKPNARSLIFARVETSVLPLARAAALDADSTQPRLPVGGTFEFVVDEGGRAIPTTFRALSSSPDAVTAAAVRALPGLRFKPALVGECPIKQEITLTGAPTNGS